MPGRRGRPPTRNVSTPKRTPTPLVASEDDDMPDADDSRQETPNEQEGDDDEEDEVGTPAEEHEEQPSEPASPQIQPLPRKRRLGRPPKNRPPDWDTQEIDRTPVRRKRGRPAGGGGFRGRPRGGPSHVTKVPIDKEGNMMDVVDDEVALPEDAEGETKVDKLGNLQGGRDYRVRVFKIAGRGDRLYMLSTEPARCTGFRDSYLFFTKHMQLYKIIVSEHEKMDLITREIIPHSYKGRAIGVVTARSVFREFGARIIIGGKRIIDDYYVTAARGRGDVEGELAELDDPLPPPGEPYNKNRYVAWHGASAVYHQGGPSVPMPNGKVVPGKRKVNITSANWQFEHARSASRFNTALTAARRANLEGIYDPHTNQMHYPKIMQPTHAKWEQLDVPPLERPSSSHSALTSRVTNLSLTENGTTHSLTNGTTHQAASTDTIFTPLPPSIPRSFLVIDTVYRAPSVRNLGVPGPDGDFWDVGPNSLPTDDPEILAELPAECREALLDAKKVETEWKDSWKDEASDGARGRLKIGFMGVPV